MDQHEEPTDLPPTRGEFAKRLMEEVRQLGVYFNIQLDSESFSLIDDNERQVRLDGLYRDYCGAASDEREQMLRHAALAFFSAEDKSCDGGNDLRTHLRPKIWARATIANLELDSDSCQSDELDLPLYPLGDHLYSSLVYDLPHAMRSVSRTDLQAWGVTYFEAMEWALENLVKATEDFREFRPGLYVSNTLDHYDSSRILLEQRIETLSVRGDLVATLPQPDFLCLTGSADDEGLEAMLELTRDQYAAALTPLSPVPICRIGSEWKTWLPPMDHSLHAPYRELATIYWGGVYQQQKSLLDDHFERVQETVHVAGYTGFRREKETAVQSYCVWADGVDVLLPRTDFVMFPGEEGIAACGTWERVQRIVGDLLVRETHYYPPRYRATSFPTAAVLDRIGKQLP